MKARFDKKQALKANVEGISDNEKLVVKLEMKEGVDVVGCVKLVVEYKAGGIEINEQDKILLYFNWHNGINNYIFVCPEER